MAVASPPFNGFSPEAIQFLADLASNNDRAWFQPRKSDYERLRKEPLEPQEALESLRSRSGSRAVDKAFIARCIPLSGDRPVRSGRWWSSRPGPSDVTGRTGSSVD